jgi:hypothetical protein
MASAEAGRDAGIMEWRFLIFFVKNIDTGLYAGKLELRRAGSMASGRTVLIRER